VGASGAASAAEKGGFWLPPAASVTAKGVDLTWWVINYTNLVFFIVLMGAMIYFAIAHKQKVEGEKTHPTKGSHALELAWAVVPSVFLLVFFALGFRYWIDQAVPPADSFDVRVTGRKWIWMFTYPNGMESSTLKVPAGRDVRLTMSSADVLHSFFVPDFRIKKDVLPSRYTVLWFNAPEVGNHQVYCTEYCGNGHSKMGGDPENLTQVEVMEPSAFNAWYSGPQKIDGEQLFTSNGCAGCHSVDGSQKIGPSIKGLYGKQEKLSDGSAVTVDDNYIRESIMVPGAKVVAGFSPVMPSFQGQLSDEKVNAIIDYIKSQGN
jgi:cytochrome c oxidase subunit 2